MKRLTREVFDQIKEAVESEAAKRGVGGFLMVTDFVTSVAMFALINRTTPFRIGVKDRKDANFAAVAGAKFGMVFAHRRDTGGPTGLLGEVPFKGGHISADGECGYIFSGAHQDVDLELMQFAEEVHAADKDEGVM